MSGLSGVLLKLGKFKLEKEKKKLKRNVKAFSIEKASSIGVIYDATNRNEYESVKKFIQYLKEERKEVLAMGFINTKDSSELVKPHLNYQFFDKNGLSKTLVPKDEEVQKFMKRPFSVLIDLNRDNCFPIEYISALSQSKFKVGAKGGYRDNVCDLVIDISKNNSLDFLIIQIKHYLKMIK